MIITGSVFAEVPALFAVLCAKVSLLWTQSQSRANEEDMNRNGKSEKLQDVTKDLTLLPPLRRC
jgi:hypothetical protein